MPNHRLFAAALFALASASTLPAQTTITYTDGETNATAYNTTLGAPYTLDLASGAATQSGVLFGTGNIVKTGAGTLNLAGSYPEEGSSYLTGDTTILAGSLNLYSGNALRYSTLTTAAGLIFTHYSSDSVYLGGLSGTEDLVLNNSVDRLYIGANNRSTTYSGTVSSPINYPLGLYKIGSGTLTLAGGRTDGGSTDVNTGTLVVAHDAALGTSHTPVSVDPGATLAFANNITVTRSGVINHYGAIINLSGDNTYAGGPIQHGGTLTVAGGSLTLTGANTFTGDTTIIAGSLILGHSSALGGSTLTTAAGLSFGNLTAATLGGLSGSQALALTNASAAAVALTVGANGASTTYSGALSGVGSLTKVGPGTLTLTGANTYTGGTTVTAGTLTLGHATALGSTTAPLTLNGGTLDLGTFTPTVGTAIFNGGTFTNGHLNNAAAYEVRSGSLAANLGGTAALTKTGTGIFTLSGANTYTGTTTVSAGTLSFANRAAYYGGTLDATTAAQLSIASGATAAFGVGDSGYFSPGDLDTILANSSFANGASLGIDTSNAAGGTYTWTSPALGTLGLAKVGTGTLILQGGSTHTGPTSIAGGTLQIGDGGATSFASTSLTNNGTLSFNSSSDITVTGSLTGPGALTKSGTGKLTLTTISSTGGITVTGGELATNSSIGNQAAVVTGAGSILRYSSFGAKTVGSTATGSLVISNGAALIGTRTGGSHHLNIGGVAGSNGTVTVNGAGSTLTWASVLRAGANGTGILNVESGATAIFGDAGDSSVGYDRTGVGTIHLSGTDSALTTVGRLLVGYLGTGTVNLGSGATLTADRLRLANESGSTGTLNLNPGGTLRVGGATGLTSGAGTATFNLAGGTVQAHGTNLTVSSPATLAASTTSTVDTNSLNATWSGVLSGSGALAKAGAGTLTLSGANTYSGAITVNAGSLVVDGSLATSAVTVNSGATLSGSGTVGALALASGAMLSPGNSPGTLTTGSEIWAGGASYLWEINDASSPATSAGTRYDLLSISGTLTINATSSDKFTLSLVSLLANNTAGDVINFNSAANSAYTIASASGGIIGFDANAFTINASGFSNALQGGTWSLALANSDRDLQLHFTAAAAIPEPSTYAAIFGALGLGFVVLRKRKTNP